MNITKKDLLTISHLEAIGFDRTDKLRIAGVGTDSRSIGAGELFFALSGEKFDGHTFLTQAIQIGVAAIVVEEKWMQEHREIALGFGVPIIVVESSVRAFGELARTYRRKFSIPVIAVGGSNGKTTSKEMIASVLSQKFNVLKTEGNLNNHIGVPQTLFRLSKKHDVAVVEIGTNHYGEIAYLCSILEPTHGIITNVGREHLEFFKDIDGVAKAEGELIEWLAAFGGKKTKFYLNTDDANLRSHAKPLKNVIRYGLINKRADVVGKVKSVDTLGRAVLEVKSSKKKTFTTLVGVSGFHNALNALSAAAIGLDFNVPVNGVRSAIESFSGASKRMQVFESNGVIYINDAYNANPDSMLAALQTLERIGIRGKRIAILADMLELGERSNAEHRMIGERLREFGVDALLTFGEYGRLINDSTTVGQKTHFESKVQLGQHLAGMIRAGDAVLVKGSRGMKMEDIFETLKTLKVISLEGAR